MALASSPTSRASYGRSLTISIINSCAFSCVKAYVVAIFRTPSACHGVYNNYTCIIEEASILGEPRVG